MRVSNLRTKALIGLLSMLLTAFAAGGIFAQSGTTGISGTVVDQAGGVVPGATVRLVNPETGFSRTTTADSQGRYSFAGIQPATYTIEVEAAGFNKLVQSNAQALVDSPVRIDLALTPGDISVVVDVTTSSIDAIVNTQDASIGNNIQGQQIVELPTDLRRVNNLLALQPGVTRDGYVAGGRSDQANITLDGVDINDQQTGGRSGGGDLDQGSALRATSESIEEFRITTLGANANQGRSSGAQISLITRSGSNDFNGAAFYLYRPTFGSANTFFNNLAGVERPSLARSVYGGRIGGPIQRDKFFFFYSYEGQFQKQEASVTRTVPLAHLGNGEIRFNGTGPSCDGSGNCVLSLAELNSIYSSAGISPTALAILSDAATRFPSNQGSPGDGLNTGGFRFNSPTTTRENTHILKLDYNINSNQQIFVRGNYEWDNISGISAFPGTPSTSSWRHPYGIGVGHNWTVSNNMINNFRYGLTRQAFSNQGDSSEPSISFRFVYSPLFFARTLSRVTPVTNITDDFTWIKGDHAMQFGGNIRIIRNRRQSFANAFDSAITNPSFYELSGAVVTNEIEANGYTINQIASVQAAATALIGRLSQYSGNFTFDIDGSVLPAGTASDRTFATEEYDLYMQDVWKATSNLTLTLGLRYGMSRPVYEKNGFQVVPNQRLGDVFERRQFFAAQGVPSNELIDFQLGGPANNAPGFYSMDWNNLQPRFAVAWSPSFNGGFLGALFGSNNESVIRGGFGITNDYFGGQLAVSFDGLSSIGFTSDTTISANTYNVTDNLAPLLTGFNMDIRALPGIPAPAQRFMTEPDEQQRIEASLDATIESPIHYSWNVSYGRSLPKEMYFEASYIGRKARNLFGARDVMALNNLVDPGSGMDWYTAAGLLVQARKDGVPITSLGAIPYFENLFPNAMAALGVFGLPANNNTQAIYGLFADDGFGIRDYTFIQLIIDDATEFGLPTDPGLYPNMFFHPQYAAFSAFGTFARSDYHGATFTLRQRLGETLSYDINYTYSKSMDDVSGLQTDGSFGGQFLLNPLRQDDSYSVSDFDSTHVVNANFLFNLPVGRGRAIGRDMNRFADALIGGWSLNGIYRWNTGQPLTVPFDGQVWATNWNVQSAGVRIRPLNPSAVRDTQNYFADPQFALNSFRNALPGETGDRNAFRLPGFQTLDLGLKKSFKMPWSENHKFDFRFEVFNVTNVQYFAGTTFTRSTFALGDDPETASVPLDAEGNPIFGKIFNDIQGNPRRIQFVFRYSF
jgi:hypothetical protein